jgi:methionyl-tRNA synthetase
MGKDNVPFHTVLFPATLLGTGKPWTLIHHISTTEYLNYETGKFSKSSSRGIFGTHVEQLPFPISVWRYYLLASRPEQADSVFNWDDFKSKINEELLPKPGNLVQRVLKFIYARMDKKVPTATIEELSEDDITFLNNIKTQIVEYCENFEVTKMRKALKTVMSICQDCNKFMTVQQIWDKSVDVNRKRIVLVIMANCIRIASCLFEPFMPDFSAKINFFLGLTRTEADEVLIETLLATDSKEFINLIPTGLIMNLPVPIIQKIDDISEYRAKFK